MALCILGNARAQELRDIGRRLDSVTVVYNKAHAELVAYERSRPPRPAAGGAPLHVDTALIAGGRIRILLNANAGPIGRAAAARADTNLLRLGKALDVFPPMVFAVNADSASRGRDDQVTVGYRPPDGGSVNAKEPVDPVAIAHWITDKAVMIGIAATKSQFSRWQRGRLPLDAKDLAAEPDWRVVRLNLLSSPSFLGKRCYEGALDACAKFLGLRPDPDPVRHWYDSLARINAVREHHEVAARDQASATAHCLTGTDDACAAALWAINIFVDPPADAMALETVTREAIALGGPSALERLATSSGTPAEALTAAANVPLDSVLARWRAKVHGDEDHSRDMTLGAVVVALLWAGVLLFLSTRSSRWN